MIVKGRRKSKNVEHNTKGVDAGIKYALDNYGEDATNAAYYKPERKYMDTAKEQLRTRRALATGKKMMGNDVGKAMESAAKRDKAAKPKGPRLTKRSRNPYE